MRILIARLVVVVTGLLIVMLAILFATIRNVSDDSRTAAPDRVVTAPKADVAPAKGDVARGRAVYIEQRCAMCHSIDGEGNTRSPLDDVSRRLTEKEIRRWIVAPQEMDPTVAKRGYRLSEEDLDALVTYLMSKRSP